MRADGYLLPRRAIGVSVMGSILMTLALVLAIPELPLRRTVREVPA